MTLDTLNIPSIPCEEVEGEITKENQNYNSTLINVHVQLKTIIVICLAPSKQAQNPPENAALIQIFFATKRLQCEKYS